MYKKRFIAISTCLGILLTSITACGESNPDDRKDVIADIVQEKDNLSLTTVNTMPKCQLPITFR